LARVVLIYGIPGFSGQLQDDIALGKIVTGGCCLSMDDPKWQCADCKVDIYMKEKPVEVEVK